MSDHLSPKEIEKLTEENLTPKRAKLDNVPWLTEEDALMMLDRNGIRIGEYFTLRHAVKAVQLGYSRGFSTGINKDCSDCTEKINRVTEVLKDQTIKVEAICDLMSPKEIETHVQKAANFAGIEVVRNE